MRVCLPACVVNVCVSDVALNDMVTYTSIHPSIPRLWGSKAKKPKRRVETSSEYAASRYVCGLKDLVDQAVQGELSAEAYPSVLPMPARYVRRDFALVGGCMMRMADFHVLDRTHSQGGQARGPLPAQAGQGPPREAARHLHWR